MPDEGVRVAEFHARIAESVVLGLRCPECLRLYSWLLIRQGLSTWAVYGIGKAVTALGWQDRTVRKHLDHLVDVGMISAKVRPGRPGLGSTKIAVVHLPCAIPPRIATLREVPGVWETEPPSRWRKPANDVARFRGDGKRDAQSVPSDGTDGGRRDAQSVPREARRATSGGASRLSDAGNGQRDAPSVLGAFKESEVGGTDVYARDLRASAREGGVGGVVVVGGGVVDDSEGARDVDNREDDVDVVDDADGWRCRDCDEFDCVCDRR